MRYHERARSAHQIHTTSPRVREQESAHCSASAGLHRARYRAGEAHTPGLVLWTTTEVLFHEQRPLATIWLQVFDSAVKLCGLAVDDHFPSHPFWNDTRTGAQEIFTAVVPSAQPKGKPYVTRFVIFKHHYSMVKLYIFSIMCLFNRVPARDVPSLILFYLFD